MKLLNYKLQYTNYKQITIPNMQLPKFKLLKLIGDILSRNFICQRSWQIQNFLMKFQWLGKCFILSHTIKNALVVLMFLLSLTGAASAVDIQVSCTIPAIPGVNVPLIEEETRIPPEDSTNTQESQTVFAKANEPQKTPQEQTSTLIQQENQLTTANEQPLIIVKTLYDR